MSFQNHDLSMNPITLTSSLKHFVGKSKCTRLNCITHFDLGKMTISYGKHGKNITKGQGEINI